MDWNEFFEKTRVAAGVDSFAKLAPLLGISDGAIGHYRQGRRVPQVWVVAEALKLQKHPQPEKAAIQIMKAAALSSPERAFWRKLAASAVAVVLMLGAIPLPGQTSDAPVAREDRAYFAECDAYSLLCQSRHFLNGLRDVIRWLRSRFSRKPSGTDHFEAFAA